MAARSKRPHMDPTPETPDQTESSSDSEGSEVGENGHENVGSVEREIQVEFEARTPEDRDIAGIERLLLQCLRGSDVDITGLANFIVNQRSVGSVVTQSHSDSTDDDDDDEDDDLVNEGEVFGLATVVRLRESRLASQITRHLARSVATTDPRNQLAKLLADSRSDVGLIISERIINMPPQISVPLYQTLSNEIRKAKAKGLPFNFSHFVLVSKVLVPPNGAGRVMNGNNVIMYTNAEEEVFEPECEFVLDMKQQQQQQQQPDQRIVTLSQEDFVEKKKVLVFAADKLEKIVGIVKNAFPIS